MRSRRHGSRIAMAPTRDLQEVIESVRDRASFITFVRALRQDRLDEDRLEELDPSSPFGPGAKGWENDTLEAFLAASASWAEDVGQLPDERQAWFPETPSWQAFARFLYMGRIYE